MHNNFNFYKSLISILFTRFHISEEQMLDFENTPQNVSLDMLDVGIDQMEVHNTSLQENHTLEGELNEHNITESGK